ncbi:MAG: hypothetical protein CM15mP74_36010 [Halieaceae bacterium]|nr:MAG: hypothetical protein CM15mP74_36010 [Halieaceae bacterium]
MAMFELIRESFNAAWLAERPAGNPDDSPIFVLGQPRTGTTLIERVITSHSQVHSAVNCSSLSRDATYLQTC